MQESRGLVLIDNVDFYLNITLKISQLLRGMATGSNFTTRVLVLKTGGYPGTLPDSFEFKAGTRFSVVPGLFFGRAGPAPRAGAGKFLRAGARTRAGPTFL